MTCQSTTEPARGEVWSIRFDPATGAEMGKIRPAVVVSLPSIGRLPLRIVVPLTAWEPHYASVPWLVYLKPAKQNGLSKKSAADCFQVKSVSLKRFIAKLGDLRAEDIEEISAAIALCVGA